MSDQSATGDRHLFPGVPWVESPQFEALFRDADPEIRRMATSLRENGYAVFDFPVDRFPALVEPLMQYLDPHFHHHAELLNVWSPGWYYTPASRLVTEIACNQVVLDMLERLFGRKPFPFQTLNFRIGSRKRAHSDSVHFSSAPERFMCGVWVAFEDVTEENGPLFYYPGSHKLPILSNDQIGVTPDDEGSGYPRFEDAWESIVEAQGFERVRFLAKRGQALVWLANLLHGGEPILDETATRRSQVTHYFFEGCRYWTPLLSEPIAGRIALRGPSPTAIADRLQSLAPVPLASGDASST